MTYSILNAPNLVFLSLTFSCELSSQSDMGDEIILIQSCIIKTVQSYFNHIKVLKL